MNGSHEAIGSTLGPVACRACELFEVCSLIDALPISSGLQRCPTLRTIARGEALYQAGAAAQHVYAIRKGVVKSVMPTSDGAKRVVALHVPGEVLGRESIARSRHIHDVIAVTPVMVCELPLKPYLRPHAELASARAAFERLRIAKPASGARRGRRVRERLETFMADLGSRLRSRGIDAEGFAFEIRRRELAELLGVHTQSLGRVVEGMQPHKSICLCGYKVVFQNVA